MKLDPITLEILANKVVAATEEMANTLQRTARTLFVKEAADYACTLMGRDGLVMAYPPASGATIFINMDANPTLRCVPDLEPGDVIVTSDPYASGGMVTHTPDITLLAPYFHDGKIVAYGFAFVHSTDVGGAVPSSIAPSLADIFAEGLRIPPVKLCRKGELNNDVVAFIKANSRIPAENMGDIRAMLGGLERGRQRVADIIARHGVEAFLTCQDDLKEYSAAKARAVLRKLPDGEYDFWDYMDDDLVSRFPIRLRVRMTVKDGAIHLDLTGTDPQVPAAYNVATFSRLHEWFTLRLISFICTQEPDIILNGGMFRSVTINCPLGTVMNAEFPAAVGLRSNPSRRFNDAMTGALLKASPDLMAAPTPGTQLIFVLGEYDEAGIDRNVVILEPMSGGMGGYKGADGVDGRDSTMSNMANHSIEFVESDTAVIVHEYDIRADSGGAGEWRGGTGQTITIEVLRDGGTIVPRGMERMRFSPWGVMGGRPGGNFRMVLDRGKPNERPLAKCDSFTVNKGDLVTVDMSGASGFGDPLNRDAQAVARDVRQGFVSAAAAEEEYGVVLDKNNVVDSAKTEQLRGHRAKGRNRPDFDFGPEREAWETVFDDATMNELTRRIFELPRSARYEARRRIFEAAVPGLPRSGSGESLVDFLKDPKAARARLRKAMDETFAKFGPRQAVQ